MELSDLEVNEYQLYGGTCPREENIRLVRRRGWGGVSRWTISARGDVLGKDWNWYIEGLPSGRNEDFINQTRWDTPEEALVFWEQYVAKYAVTIHADDDETYAMLDWERIQNDMGA